MTPLQYAIDHNKDKIIQQILLQYSCKYADKIDIRRRSFKSIIGKEIEIFEKTLLYMSIETQNIIVIKSLLARTDVNINEKSYHLLGNNPIQEQTALHLAAKIGNFEMIKLLLEKKEVDIHIEDHQGKKPIDYSKNDEIRQLLS